MSIWSTLASIGGSVLSAIPGVGLVGNLVGTGLSSLGSGLAQDESNANYLKGVSDTNAANIAIADKNNAESWRRLQAQNQFNEQMWNKNNQYNSPAAMLARLRAAGLNPAAFTGESPAAQVQGGQVPGMSTPTLQAPGQTPVPDYADMTQRLMANELVKGQQIKNTSDAISLDFLTQEKQLELQKKLAEISETKSMSAQNSWATRKLAQDYDHFASIAEYLRKGAALQVDDLNSNISLNKEKTREIQREQDRKDLMYELQVDANDRAWKQLDADLERISLEWSRLAFDKDRWNDPTEVRQRKQDLLNTMWSNALVRQQYRNNKREFEKQLESLDWTIDQQASDYYNPFRYAGMLLGGAAAAGVGAYSRSQTPSRVVVKGFVR